jgi:coniferyl-aldehyde dehydrogenase
MSMTLAPPSALAHSQATLEAGERPSELDALNTAYAALRSAWDTDGELPYAKRMDVLGRLLKAIRARKEEIADALHADFGGRSRHESILAEVWTVVEEIKHTREHLAEWMEPRIAEVGWQFQPGTGKVLPQAKGVVGIMAPWNFPVQLTLSPLVPAIAAGNRVLIKPSEFTPNTNAVVAKILNDAADASIVRMVVGDGALAAHFSRLPLDHILFTGSTRVGSLVMQAAAERLTPVTLELGGKSPLLVHESFSITKAAERCAAGKLLNAGQICIAPDYALVPKDQVEAFATAFQATVTKAYPKIVENPDYTSIINEHHHRRLTRLVEDARGRGAKVIEINPASETIGEGSRRFFPTLLLGVTDEMAVMQEEIFGPVLPIVGYDDLPAALRYITARPRPLALYYFDRSGKRCDEVLKKTRSGGVTLNDVLVHQAQNELPFGGVGPSGLGAYHGYEGFRTLSHFRSVFSQSRLAGTALLLPPYGRLMNTLLRLWVG